MFFRMLILCIFMMPSLVLANKGYEIAKKVSDAAKGFETETSEMEMQLINRDQVVKRKMMSKNIEVNADDSKALMEFVLPKDVAGTKLLTWSYKTEVDRQWIFLPAFRKTKKISSSTKKSSFMGSEFTFEDLRASSIDKFTYKFIKEEKKGDDTFWIYESRSKKSSGYSMRVVTASKKYMNVVQVEFYDRSKSLLKRAISSNFKSYKFKGKTFWKPSIIHMKNIQTKKESKLIWEKRTIGTPLKEKNFSKASLKR